MQFSLFIDYFAYIDSCPFLKKYDALFQAFDMIYDQPDYPALGRKGYPRSAYLKALLFKQLENIKYMSDLVRDLESRPVIAQMCGLDVGSIPDDSSFSRFLSETNNSELKKLFHQAGALLVDNDVATLDIIIADSKPIKANTKHNNLKNPNRKRDKKIKIKRNPKATFGYYSYLKQPCGKNKKEMSFFWGYRTHVLTSKEGIPLAEITLPNNHTDDKVAESLLNQFIRVYGQKRGRIFIADAGYDKRELYDFIVEKLKAEPFIPLNPRNKQPDKTLGPHGLPLCQAELEMKYIGICRETHRARKGFRCPIRAGNKKEKALLPDHCPINHERFCTGKRYGCTGYIDITVDNRSQVPRESKRYKRLYKLRTESERYFARLGPREVEEMTSYKYRSIRNQMTLAHLALSLVSVAAALVLAHPDKIRCYKTFADTA